jgi:uncharacterized protein YjiS (DUF1127 family)
MKLEIMMLLLIGNRFRFHYDFFKSARALRARLIQMREAAIGRRQIAKMDDRMLADIGLSRADALMEINRRPWDAAPISRQGLRGDT